MRLRLQYALRSAREEDGFTLIEVLVAAVVLALAALATFGVLVAATRNAQRAQATQVALDKAQEEMEKLHSLSYSQLALKTLPEHRVSPKNPNSRVSGNNFAVRKEPPGDYSEMVRNGRPLYGGGLIEGGVVIPGPIPFEEGNVSGELYRYIVWRDDPSCTESTEGTKDFCPGNQDFKQLIVTAKLDAAPGQGERSYVEVQSQVSNPQAIAQRSTQGDNTGGPGSGGTPEEEEERKKEEEEDKTGGLGTGKAVTAQQFFLSDTPCSNTGTTTRETILGDHLLHNTLGTCASGAQTGSELGAPDALLLDGPPDPAPADETNPLLYDYASDSYLEPTPDTDKGVQILRDDTSGCHFEPTSTVRPEAKVHRWVTDPMPEDFKMNGVITLEFYSRTLNETSYPGTVCVFLFVRDEAGPAEEPTAFDTPLLTKVTGSDHWVYSTQGNDSWPRTKWERLRLPMEFADAPKTILEGDRLGVALSVDPANTPADAIPVMYDHPNYPTRLEVDTTAPLEGG